MFIKINYIFYASYTPSRIMSIKKDFSLSNRNYKVFPTLIFKTNFFNFKHLIKSVS